LLGEVLLAVWGAIKTVITVLFWLAFPIALRTLGLGYVPMPSISLVLFLTCIAAFFGAVASLARPTAFKPLVSMVPRLLGFILVASMGTSITINAMGIALFLDLSPVFYLLFFLFVLLPTIIEVLETHAWWLES